MGIEAIGNVLKINRLRWFGHVERKDKKEMHVYGVGRPRGRPRMTLTWLEVVKNDMMDWD